MVITNLQQKENRKIWVPIRGGNRGGWSLFDWQKVREMPYRDREMYLGNSAKIGILDKGGKWRKKDWYLKRNHLQGEELEAKRQQAMKRDRQRMNTGLGIEIKEEDEQLTPAEMQMLLKRIKGGKEDDAAFGGETTSTAIGLGFDKTKVEIRAKPTAKVQNPHRLEGTAEQHAVKVEPKDSDEQEERKRRKKKDKKEDKREERRRERSDSREAPRKKHVSDQQSPKKKKKHRHRSPSSSAEKRKEKRKRSSSASRERDSRRHRDDRHRDEERRERSRVQKHSKRHRHDSD